MVCLCQLDRRARIVLGLLARQDQISTNDVANVLGLSDRQARNLLNDWVEAGWLEMSDRSRKTRAYRLSEKYRQFIGTKAANTYAHYWPSCAPPGRPHKAVNPNRNPILPLPLSETYANLRMVRLLFGSCFNERCLKPGLTCSPQAFLPAE
jgi:hypothetical protein